MVSENLPSLGRQQELSLFPLKEVEIDGIQMGVLNDGTPYLTGRGLAEICGVHHKVIQDLSADWQSERIKPRGRKIDVILKEQGFDVDSIYEPIGKTGKEYFAYPDYVCMAVLEYYAFESQTNSLTALRNYRLMARRTLRDFIYRSLGIDPDSPVTGAWKCFQERIILNDKLPAGYFSVFREMVDISVPLINAGFEFNQKNVIDISVGIRWANFWKKNNLSDRYGEPTKHPHTYPDWFPQSKAGPQPANIYPEESLGEFRRWMRDDYIQNGLPKYLSDKVDEKVIEQKKVMDVLEHLQQQKLPKK
ncbi:TPA: hypothetical protein K8J16_001163 [Serratia marcescens]|uniref:hypothetical protein n=1 Tax=Serratia marcescens TaxID=615 RepID=UPI001C76C80D|nr:hypothetical protein [Serratia marcescens]BCZ39804.1 hypothetical protein SMGES_11300 [Serratia marcescens]HBI6266464.1 hypothetical protein [Serratia marcescens]HBI6947647.1 hypothetical protein [Serratia marcescens]